MASKLNVSGEKRRSSRVCAACGRTNNTKAGVTLHKFPLKNSDISKQWTVFVQQIRSEWQPTQYSVLCSNHFERSSYVLRYEIERKLMPESKYQYRLKPDAVPTIFAPDEHVKEQRGAVRKRKRISDIQQVNTISS